MASTAMLLLEAGDFVYRRDGGEGMTIGMKKVCREHPNCKRVGVRWRGGETTWECVKKIRRAQVGEWRLA